MYELKNYRGVMCTDTEEWWKVWRGIDLSFQNWHEEFDELWLENSKASRICTLMGSFWPTYIILKYILPFLFSVDNTIVYHVTGKYTCILVHGVINLLCNVCNVWAKKAQRCYLSWHWRLIQNMNKNWLVVWKPTWGIWPIFTRALESRKIGALVGFLCAK